MCSNQVTNLQRQAQPQNINGRWGRQKNFDASRCQLNSLLFFLVLLQSSRQVSLPPPPAPPCKKFSAIIVDCQKVGLSYIHFFGLSLQTLLNVLSTLLLLSHLNIGLYHPIAKWRENVNVLFFKIQQTGLKTCYECILYCMRKYGCFELPFPLNPSKHLHR